MKKFLLGVVVTLAIILAIRACSDRKEEDRQIAESTQLIQEQIAQVAKLIVTEGHFAEVYNYHDARQVFGPLISAKKKALVVVNAEVTVAYDLRRIQYELDEENRTLRILSLPEPEIKINPDFEYYDVQADYLNPFEAEDYNAIKDEVKSTLLKKVNASSLMDNARNRLLSELSKLMMLTQTVEWTLEYENHPISELKDLELTHQGGTN